MEYVRLKDICDLKNGYAFKSSDYIERSNTLNCRMSNIRPNAKFDIEYNAKYLPDDYAEEYSEYILNDGDIVIAMTDLANDPKILGVPTIVETKGYSLLLNQRVGKLILKNDIKIDKIYLKYALNLPQLKSYYKKFAGGGLQINIGKEQILNIKVPIITYKNQQKIVEVLDRAQSLIDKRKAQIEALDELVKSRFIKMCANGSSDYENWEKLKIEDMAEQKKGSMRTGPFGSSLLHSEFVDEGIFVLGIDNAVENHFTWNKMRYITNGKYERLRNYTVYPGDVIITIMGTVGRSAVIPDDFPKAINTKHLACITLNKLIANPYFISYCIHGHPYVINQLKNESKGAIMDGLNLTIIRSIKIPLPPIEVQESFVHFMNQVDKLKFEMEKSLKELEDNFNSLMQKAFKGELFN
ncbi:restriction endonuclease subunit S [Clostridium sporogenes]|uniref:restriction endonuclease subunit S n=1 Tax=Clostridium sporogenes TaxID=1509 RepID=UPI003DA26079